MPITVTGTQVAGAERPRPEVHPAEWSDTNLPWAYTAGTAPWLTNLGIPAGIPIVALAGTGTDFKARLDATVAAQSGPFVVQLEAGVYELPAFYPIGGGSEFVAYWDNTRKLAGMVGRGPDKTFVQVAADCMPPACITYMQGLAAGPTGEVSQVAALRIDHTASHGVYAGGITFRGQDQNDMTFHTSLSQYNVFQPQPAPYMGFRPYTAENNVTRISHCRFQAFGHCVTSLPPFEDAQVTTQYAKDFQMWSCEFDGRVSATFNSNRPRRGTVWQMNNETSHQVWDTWGHHTNITRYAANDGNRVTFGTYRVERCKFEHITDNRNSGDPAYNGGGSLGGWTDACPLGWESTAAAIYITDSIVCQDNPNTSSGQKPLHFQHTHVQGPLTSGGRMYVTGTECRFSGQPTLEGWATVRLDDACTFYIDGPATTLFLYHPTTDVRLTYYPYTGTWPPNPATFPPSVTSASHYIAQII